MMMTPIPRTKMHLSVTAGTVTLLSHRLPRPNSLLNVLTANSLIENVPRRMTEISKQLGYKAMLRAE
ncbi:hypothetical protein IG631_18569 [Alternaria alternata]|nr:hypothetical protein IG631_18569 [Alternaria alternata]